MNRSQTSPSSPGDQASEVNHRVPEDQPKGVHDVASRLLAAYTVENGRVHLAGCTLDEVPVVRFAGQGTRPTAEQCLIFGQAYPEGRPLDDALFTTLGLDHIVEGERPATVSPRDVEKLVEAARASSQAEFADDQTTKDGDCEIIWCKYARGKIQFTIGDTTGHAAFAGWARVVQAPPYHCDVSNTDTFAVAATSDGRIVAADQLGQCEVSGRRLPLQELVECVASKQLVARDLTAKCPASGQHVLSSALVACPTCRQNVSPAALKGSRCAACRRLSTAPRDDHRVRTILSHYPRLSAWQWLRLAETDDIYILTASGILERRLLVLEKPTLEILRAARATRFKKTWIDVPLGELESFW